MSADPARFQNIGFEDFRKLASDPGLSKYEKIGFPDSYRQGHEEAIFSDIKSKLPALQRRGAQVLDIGPGCSDLPRMLISHCQSMGQGLALVDSAEMLEQLPDGSGVEKVPALFPRCPELLERLWGKVDVQLSYSELHYVFVDTPLFGFLDCALSLLAPGGAMLIGDIPNASKRRRFFASEAGIRFHKKFMKTEQNPPLEYNKIEHSQIDDAVLLGMLARARSAGFDAYVLPQPESLPMSNRREDLLITRP